MRTDLTYDQCLEVLKEGHYGHLAYCLGDQPFVVPVTCVFYEGALYSYTQEGHKIDVMRKNPQVCLQMENVKNGHEWQSVACQGTFEEVTDQAKIHAVHLLLADQYAKFSHGKPGVIVSPLIDTLNRYTNDEIKKSVVYRIIIKKCTGKAEVPK